MPDLQELFSVVTDRVEPGVDAWIEQERRQRRAVRNRKLGVIALVAAVLVGIGVFALVSRPRTGSQPATNTPSPITAGPAELGLDEQDVALVDLEGRPVAAVPGLPADAYALSLSADGTRIAFVTGRGAPGIDQIATIALGGSAVRVLPTDGMAASMPAWSPDGTMIAFEGRTDDRAPSDLFVMDADGSNVRRLTTDPTSDIYPQWSPDGSTIAYASGGRPGAIDAQYSPTADIWTIPVDGDTPTRLTSSSGWDGYPSYSPDGSRIAYAGRDGIWLMNADGGRPHLAIEDGGFTPRWSPDGTRIAYTTYDSSYRPTVDFGAGTQTTPLVVVNVADVSTGEHHLVGDVGMATDLNTPVWWSNDLLLIRRVGH